MPIASERVRVTVNGTMYERNVEPLTPAKFNRIIRRSMNAIGHDSLPIVSTHDC